MTRSHYRIFGLISAGYFLDIANLVVFGSLVPVMLQTNFLTRSQVAIVGSATLFGLAIGCIGQGEFTDRVGRKTAYQFNLLLFGAATVASAFAPDYIWLAALRFLAGVGLGAEQPLCFAYAGEYAPMRIRGRILSCVHFIGGACSWPLCTLFTLYFAAAIGWRGIYAALGAGALGVFMLRFSLPESPRWLAIHGKGDQAIGIIKLMGLPGPSPAQSLVADAGSHERRDPFLIVFRDYPLRVTAGIICFVAFFAAGLGLSTWLPDMMAADHGMTITRSLTYMLGMTIAIPCASAFMMFAIEHFGRKLLSIGSFLLAGVFAAAFTHTTTDTGLLVVGFWMVFFVQLAGNSMQILISEVFPTSVRATGFGIASGTGRLATAFVIPAILVIQSEFGTEAVFACLGASLAVAASFIPLLGPETQGRPLDVVVPETASVTIALARGSVGR